MANVKISALPNLGNLADGTQFPVANVGNTFSVTASTIKTYVVGTGFSVGNSIISNVAEPVGNSDAATKSYVDSATSSTITIEDDASQTTSIGLGDTLTFDGTASEVTVAVTSGTVTFGLPDNVTVTGNLGAGNLSGTNITGTLSTAAQTNITSVGTLTSLNVTGNVLAGNLNSNAAVTGATGVFSGNVTGGNISTGGVISATGNITGSYFLGNGSQLTGIDATAIQNGTSNVRVASSGNVTVSSAGIADVLTVTGTGANITGTLNATGNANVGNLGATTVVATTLTGTLSTAAQTNITSVGTLTALTVTGNVSTGNVSGTAGTFTNVTGTLQTAAQTNITSVGTLTSLSVTGNITGGNLLINTDAIITGNLTVQGNTTTINSNVITTNDLNITVGNNQSTGAALNNAGIDVGNNNLATWRFNNATTSWQSNIAVMPTANGTLTLGGTSNYWGAAYVTTLDATGNANVGNIGATAVVATNVTGTLQTAAQTNVTSVGTLTALAVTGNITSGNLSGTSIVGTLTTAAQTNITSVGSLGSLTVTGNASTGNVSGTAGTFTNVTGTLQTAAQTNITSVGTLTSLAVTGNITSGNLSGTSIVGTLTTAAQTNITSVGALGAGSITSGFGAIDIGTDTITVGGIINANGNGAGNIGSSGTQFNTVFAKATSAQYADLAEKYTADADYAPGTVVKFGGSAEITVCNNDHDPEIAGVVSTNPAHIMNAGLQGDHVTAVALTGRVPCHVQGPVRRGQMLVSAGNGRARAETHPAMGTVIGKALEDFNGDIGTIEAVVGRL